MSALSEFDIRHLLSDSVDGRIARLQVLATIDSTNSYLKGEPAPAPGYWSVVVAHEQTDGRGRGGNAWHSPPGGGLWLSAAHTFETPPASLAPLTLVLGVAVASELEALGVKAIGVKWPNDVVADGRKLGGILVETASPGATAVMGLGLNLRLPEPADIGGDAALAPVDLASLLAEPPKRAPLAAAILERFAEVVPRYAGEGLEPFMKDWQHYDWLTGKAVRIVGHEPAVTGTAAGIGCDGALIVRDGDTEHRVVSGTVRLAES